MGAIVGHATRKNCSVHGQKQSIEVCMLVNSKGQRAMALSLVQRVCNTEKLGMDLGTRVRANRMHTHLILFEDPVNSEHMIQHLIE